MNPCQSGFLGAGVDAVGAGAGVGVDGAALTFLTGVPVSLFWTLGAGF